MLESAGVLANVDEYRHNGCAGIDEATAYYFDNGRVDSMIRRGFVAAAQNYWSWA